MAEFNINNFNKEEYKQVTFLEGLAFIKAHPGEKLYSDGLAFDEYMVYVSSHYEYEDGCFLGRDEEEIIDRIGGGKDCWVFRYNFYIKQDIIQPVSHEIRDIHKAATLQGLEDMRAYDGIGNGYYFSHEGKEYSVDEMILEVQNETEVGKTFTRNVYNLVLTCMGKFSQKGN